MLSVIIVDPKNTKMLVYKRISLVILLSVFHLLGFSQDATTTKASIHVDGVCVQCKHRIEKALKLKGVQSGVWDVSTHQLSLSYDPAIVSMEQIQDKIVAAGHDTELKKAKDETYNALPECCHYREMTSDAAIAVVDSTDQSVLRGIVVENANGQVNPLAGATLTWAGTNGTTISNPHGEFMLKRPAEAQHLVISYAGFKKDTVTVEELNDIQVSLNKKENLSNV